MSTGAAIIGALRAVFGADTAAFEKGIDKVHREMKRTERSFKKFGDKLSGIGQKMSLGVTAPLLAIGVASVQTATSMEELESAFDVTFGSASDSVRKWAIETGDALGRSTKEIQESAVAFQSLFGKALDPEQATELTKQFSVLTQDLASFKDLSNEVAQQKLFSGLTGEAEPLRAVGVFINEAAVSAKALELGLDKVNGKYTDQQKIVARAALIQEQLSAANGDVIKTFDSTANQLKRSQAAFEELRVSIGTQLLPVITPLIVKVADALTWFSNLPEPVINTTLAIAGIAAAVGPVLAALGSMITLFAPLLAGLVAVTGATTALGAATAIALSPITLIVAAIGAATLAYKAFSPALLDNKEARDDLYSLISENEGLMKREKATTIDQARLNLVEAKSIRERIKARLEEQEALLKKQVKGYAALNVSSHTRGLVAITGLNKKMAANISETGQAIAASREALERNAGAISDIEKTFADLGGTTTTVTTSTELLTAAQIKAKQKAEEMALAAKKLAESHKESALATASEIEENTRLTEALNISQREYEITAASIELVKDGYQGTKEEIRDLALSLLESREAMSAAEEMRQKEIESQQAATAEIKKRADAEKRAAEERVENHDKTISSVEKEIENNRLLAEALAISTREYEIQVEVLRLLEGGYTGTSDGARKLAEDLVISREKLEKVGLETEKTEKALSKAGLTGASAFDKTLNSFESLLGALKSGDLEGILGGVLNILQDVFKVGEGSGSGGLSGILDGAISLFGGGRASGGSVASGVTYLVGEKGPELFTPPGRGTIIPNDQLTGGFNQGPKTLEIKVSGARGNAEIMQMVNQGVSQGLQGYDNVVGARVSSNFNRKG